MHRKSIWPLVRMSIGSVVGILGFGTLSMGFVALSGARMALGVIEILAGVFFSLGVLSPMRKHQTPPRGNP